MLNNPNSAVAMQENNNNNNKNTVAFLEPGDT